MTTHDNKHKEGVLQAIADFHHGYKRLRSRSRPERRTSRKAPDRPQTSPGAEIDDGAPLFRRLPATLARRPAE